MANETIVTIIGHIGSDPVLRFTPSGAAVANFSIGSSPRTFDRQSNEWKDGQTLWMNCSAWKQLAENVAESLTRGMKVIAQGRLSQREYEKDGQKRTVIEMTVDEIGPALSFATAKVQRAERSSSGYAPVASDDAPPF